MTLDSTSDSTSDDAATTGTSTGTPAATGGTTRRTGRRRATRSAAPPVADETPQGAPATVAAPADAPAPAAATRETAPQGAVPQDAAPQDAAPAEAPKAARRPRRATRGTTAATTTAATTTAPTEAAPAAPTEAPPAAATVTAAETEAGTLHEQPAEAAPRARRAKSTAKATTGAKSGAKGSRRATKAAEPAAEAAPAAEETGAPVLDVLSAFGLTAAPADAATPVAEPDADALLGAPQEPRRAAKGRRAKSGPKAATGEEQAAPESATPAEAPADAPAEPAEKKPARRARRATTAKTAQAAPAVAETTEATVAEATEVAPADATGAPAEPKTRARRSRRATAAAGAPETTPAAQPAGATEADRSAGTAADRAASPAATTGAGAPRLATTALLFQAPDPAAAPRRPRRAQSPAGPPRHHDVPAEAAAPAQDAAAETAAQGTVAQEPVAPAVAPPAEQAEVVAEVVLTGEDRAAVEEVELIESELVAEGVELPEDVFGPEDFAETDEPDEAEAATPDAADEGAPRRRRRRGGRGRRGRSETAREDGGDESADEDEAEAPAEDAPAATEEPADAEAEGDEEGGSSRRRRRRRRGGRGENGEGTSTRTRPRERSLADEVTALKGSTRLEAKRQRRREGRDAGRRRQIITEAEFLARRESVERSMVVRETNGRTQIAVLEDGVLVEHYVSQQSQTSMAGNVYLGRVQNVLPSMEAAFIDVGKGRNAVLYAGEVNWDAAGLEGQPRRIEQALKSGDTVLVQVTKDPIGHKGARLTSQITLAGRYLVFVPGGGMTGISRKLPDTERNRLKKILKEVVPDGAGVIVRTAAEGASEDELRADVERLRGQWEAITEKAARSSKSAPVLLQGEPDLSIRVVRDIFNDDFSSLVVQGEGAWTEISSYVEELAPDLRERVSKWTGTQDVFTVHRVDEQLAKGMDRKVWLPSGGSLVIDRTEAMTVVDVNTGKFTGSGGTLEETVTRNNLEAAEEIVRQLRLRDIGGIIVIDFIDMVLESNRDLVLRRLVECLGRDRTKHQVAEVTSLGLVQMTRKRVGQGLVEAFSETCEHCHGRGFIVHTDPIEKSGGGNGQGGGHAPAEDAGEGKSRSRRKRGGSGGGSTAAAAAPAGAKDAGIQLPHAAVPVLPEVSSQAREAVKATLATIAAAAAHAHEHGHDGHPHEGAPAEDAHEPGGTEPAPADGPEAGEDQA